MRKYLVLVPLVLAFGLGAAFAGEAEQSKEKKHSAGLKAKQAESLLYGKPDVFRYTKVRGKQGRKYVRHFLLRGALVGDKKKIFAQYGYTPHRLRSNFGSTITERWKYYKLGLEFTFDDDSNLIETRHFWPEDHSVN